MPPPPETCSECGKTISRKAIAHVWDGQRVVCNGCFRKLDGARRAKEAAAAAARVPATERQIRYALELGLSFPPDISSQRMSDLIREAVNPPASPELIAKGRAL